MKPNLTNVKLGSNVIRDLTDMVEQKNVLHVQAEELGTVVD